MRELILRNNGLKAANPQEFPKQSYDPDPSIKQSFLGTPVWSNLVIPAGTYETLEGDVIDFEGITIDSVLLAVSQSKNIVKTPTVGKNGTVKEYISDGDYMISIGGVLVGERIDVYPEQEFANLVELLKAPVSIKVESEFLAFFGITEIAIESYDTPQTKGFRNMQLFNISALSDEPIELRTI